MSTITITLFGISFNIFGLILLALGLLFFYGMWTAHRNKNLIWTDLITRDGQTVSTTKILQLVGGVVGTWIVVQVTLGGSLTWDIFAIYLAYVASVDGFSKLLIAKYGSEKVENNSWGSPRYRPQTAVRRDTDETLEDTRPTASARTPLD